MSRVRRTKESLKNLVFRDDAFCDGSERGFLKGEGLNSIDLGCLDQRCDATSDFATLVMTGEQRIFPLQSNRPDQVFDFFGVDLDAAVVQEGLQSILVAVDVGQLLAEA